MVPTPVWKIGHWRELVGVQFLLPLPDRFWTLSLMEEQYLDMVQKQVQFL